MGQQREGDVMKKRFAVLIGSIMAALAVCFALVGCGGGSSADNAKNFVGYWELTAMTASDGTDGAETLSLMASLGLTTSLTLNEDGTATLDMFGDKSTGTWTATSATVASVDTGNGTIDFTLSGDKLTAKDGEDSLTFTKGSASSSTTTGTTTTETVETTGTTAMSAIIADDATCKIEVTGKSADYAGDPGYNLTITNKTDKAISVVATYGSFSVNGKMCEAYIAQDVAAGKYADSFMFFFNEDLGGGGIDALTNVEGTLEVVNADTYDTITNYSVKL